MATGGVEMKLDEFKALIQIVETLRDPEKGCPWDIKQTHESLLASLVEETYEFIDAVKENNDGGIREELGDILLQVLLHCQIARESGGFDIESLSRVLREKLVRRHPHVFGGDKAQGAEEALEKWEEAKRKETGRRRNYEMEKKNLMAPALSSSLKIGKKAAELNFDWDNLEQVAYKVEEEWQELKEEMVMLSKGNQERVKEEMGDILFSCAQLSRHLGIDPEEALNRANRKFIRRFNHMEERLKAQGLNVRDLGLKELDGHWDAVKEAENHDPLSVS